ncbi:MAG: ankyrin repeat domain-containing protein [Oligoflexia bacterium]|nr:ankyrin repeat domain-containing protein [Oligoflexia bacterium]
MTSRYSIVLLTVFMTLSIFCNYNYVYGSDVYDSDLETVNGSCQLDEIDMSDSPFPSGAAGAVIGDPELNSRIGIETSAPHEVQRIFFVDFMNMSPELIFQLFVQALSSGKMSDMQFVEHTLANIEVLQRDPTQNAFLKRNILALYLLWAVQMPDGDAAEYALTEGADPNVIDQNGISPLKYAVRAGNPEMVTSLLEKGADLTRPENVTCLDDAIALDFGEIVSILRAHGARHYSKNKDDGQEKLFDAIKRVDVATIEQLLDLGVSVSKENNEGETPYAYTKRLLQQDLHNPLNPFFEEIATTLQVVEEMRLIFANHRSNPKTRALLEI